MVIVYHINPSQRVLATIERILSDWLRQAPACGEVPPPGTARDSQRLTLSSAVRLAFAPALYRGVTTIGRRWRWLRGDQPSRHRPSGACSAETKPAAGINGSLPAGSRCRSERLIADLASHRHAATRGHSVDGTLNNAKGEQSANAYATRLSGGRLRALRPAEAAARSQRKSPEKAICSQPTGDVWASR